MSTDFEIRLDRFASATLADQIRTNIRGAILDGRLAPGTRLPSWRDLATQLGVAKGTVRVAYERLTDESLIVAAGPAGTRVSSHHPDQPLALSVQPSLPLRGMLAYHSSPPHPFQMGVPAKDEFPALVWSRLRARAARAEIRGPNTYPDPRGEPALRIQVASYLAIARGLRCNPDQVIINGGYRSSLNLAIRTLALEGRAAWMEEPGYPIGRRALELCGLRVVPVRVDEDGLDITNGIEKCPEASLVLVTPGQQAPLGMTMAAARRAALLNWANSSGAWIIEDDFLGDLQIDGRAEPSLASTDKSGRVIYVGSFSKTMSPALGLGFLVAPRHIVQQFSEVAVCLAPALNTTTQRALAEFLSDGHYMRHLRRMKTLHSSRREHLLRSLQRHLQTGGISVRSSGLAIKLLLPPNFDDVQIAAEAARQALAPIPLSPWYAEEGREFRGLLLGVTNFVGKNAQSWCDTLKDLISRS